MLEALRDRPEPAPPSRASAPRGERPGRGHKRSSRLVRTLGIVGRTLTVLGLLLLFYVTYLLWGTSVYTQQAQAELRQEIAAKPLVPEAELADGEIPSARPATTPEIGDALFTLDIPKIGIETVVVNGATVEALKKGPGRFPDCREQGRSSNGIVECVEGAPWPGEDGNLALSGHRTTYGAPFFRIDELAPGDPITLEAGSIRYRYRVREQRIVSPSEVDVIEDHGRNELTLFACHPRFSAAQRIVVHADFEGAERVDVEPVTGAPGAEPGDGGDGGGDASLVPSGIAGVPQESIALGAVALLALLGAMALSERFRGTALWATVTMSTAAGLWVGVFPQILKLLPANY